MMPELRKPGLQHNRNVGKKTVCVRVSKGQTPMENTQISNLKSMETLYGLSNCSLKDHAIIVSDVDDFKDSQQSLRVTHPFQTREFW